MQNVELGDFKSRISCNNLKNIPKTSLCLPKLFYEIRSATFICIAKPKKEWFHSILHFHHHIIINFVYVNWWHCYILNHWHTIDGAPYYVIMYHTTLYNIVLHSLYYIQYTYVEKLVYLNHLPPIPSLNLLTITWILFQNPSDSR